MDLSFYHYLGGEVIKIEDEKLLVLYLLGELSEEEQSRLEKQYFVNDGLHEELRATERDLIDRYVRGELSGHEQERFEKHFLASPRRRQRVEFAKALAKSISTGTTPASSLWQSLLELFGGNYRILVPATAALIALIVIGGLWLMLAVQNETEQTEQAAQQQDQRPPEVDEQPPQPEAERPAQPVVEPRRSQRPITRIATLVLTASLERGNEERKDLIIRRNVEVVKLQLNLERDDYRRYQAVVQTPEGERIWSGRARRTKSGKAVEVRLPAERLVNQDYIVRLSGVTAEGEIEEDLSKYYFRVVKQ